MQHGFLKVAVGTPSIRVADCRYNAEQIIALIRRAEHDGAQLLAMPELCITGYTCGDLFMQDALQRGTLDALSEILAASRESELVFVIGMPLTVRNSLFNCAVVIQHGTILGVVPKTYLPNYGEFYEKRLFAPASDTVTSVQLFGSEVPFGSKLLFCCTTMPDFILGIELCEDLWSPMPPSTKLALHGATVIVNLSASDEAVTKAEYRRKLVQVQSAKLS